MITLRLITIVADNLGLKVKITGEPDKWINVCKLDDSILWTTRSNKEVFSYLAGYRQAREQMNDEKKR